MPLIKQRGFKGLNFSILCDVFLLTVLLLLSSFETSGQNVEIVPGVFSEDDLVLKPIVSEINNSSDQHTLELSRRFDLYGDYSKSPHDTIHRILRDEDTAIRSDDDRVANIRWKKSADSTAHRKLSKRETSAAPDSILLPNTNSSSANSTKSLDLVNSNLTKFVIDSDLELQLKQSDDRQTITRLNLTNNLLTEFQSDVLRPGLSRVTHLDLSHNRLEKFVLAEHSTLESLNLSGNNMSSFTVNGNQTQLRSLSIRNNNLTSERILGNQSQFDLTPIDSLETLDLACNQLTQVNSKLLGSGRALKRLNLSRNRLRHIGKDAFYNLLNIETLVLSYNQIESIDAETFMVLPNLEYLDLSYNAIGAESIRSLQGIPDLVGLSIAYNPNLGDALQEFVASWSLKELDASGTGLCRIPSALAQSVRTLVLVDNWFEIIRCGDLDSYPLLQYLDLSGSHIVEIEDDALGRLEILQTLFLDHNQLKRIPVSLPTNLENLFLQNNEITDIQPQSLQQLTSLRTLDLSHNKLTYIPGLPLPKLLVLNLQSSGLRGLSQSVVKTSPKLRDLLLDGNPIKCTELMGIAEWASPCQNRDTATLRASATSASSATSSTGQDKSNQQGIKKAFIETHDYLVEFPDLWQECPLWMCGRDETNYRRTPLCATIKINLLLQTNKLETQFNRTSASGSDLLKVIVPNGSSSQSNEEIENSIEVKPAVAALLFPETRRRPTMDKHPRNIVEGRGSQAKLLPNSTTAATDKRLGQIVDDNKNIFSTNARSNQRENKINDRMLADVQSALSATTIAPISLTTIGSQMQHNMTEIVSTFTRLSGEIARQQQQQTSNGTSDKDTSMTMPTRQMSSTTSTTSIPPPTSQRNDFLSTSQPKLLQQISTNSHVDKLPQSSATSQPSTTLSAPTEWNEQHLPTTINVAVSDEMKTTTDDDDQTKMMMLAIQRIDDVTPVEQQDITQVTTSESLNIASGHTYPETITSTTMPTTAPTREALHLARIVSKMSSSKVNKADKVVDDHHNPIPLPRQLLPSAINENGIIKRNQNSSSYYGHSLLVARAEGVASHPGHASDDEKLIPWPAQIQSSSVSSDAMNKGDDHQPNEYQDISQQNQQTTKSTVTVPSTWTGEAATTSAISTKKKSSHLLVDKMKDDKHLRFVGAKNLNLTVLTYNRKGHIHKTINKDISPKPRHPSSTLPPGEQQIFVELGVISASIESQSTTSASVRSIDSISTSIPWTKGHVKVNKKRIANESNNRQDNNRHQGRPDDAELRPQLNALHALAVTTPNATSTGNAAGLVPAERWLDIRSATGHPGLLVVIGLTIGVFFTLGLIHIYRCRRPWRRASSHLHNDNFHSPHCCTNIGIESGGGNNLHERSPGHFCSYSYNSTDDDAGYYIEPEQNRIRTATRRDFLPMELLRSSTSGGSCRDSKGRLKGGGHHFPEGHVPSIW